MIDQEIKLLNVKVHNLKSVNLTLPQGKLIVFTGVSGSGKSSLAFDTIYAEGQRRYIESLPSFARKHLGEMAKPELDSAEGITPTISIEQKTLGKNPRSTVGTMTEIYDYLRVLFSRVSTPHCPISKEPVYPESRETIIRKIQYFPKGTKILILAPFAKGKKGAFKEDFEDMLRKGFTKARIDGTIIDIDIPISLDSSLIHDIDIIFDRLKVEEATKSRIAESVTKALEFSKGSLIIYDIDSKEEHFFSEHAYSPKSGLYYSPLEPQDFSFNSPIGMCDKCQGLGIVDEFDLEKIIDPSLSIREDCCLVASSINTVRYGNIYSNLAEIYGFNLDTPWKNLSDKAKKVFLWGTEKKWTRMSFVHPVTGATWTDYVHWRGVLYEARERLSSATSDSYISKMKMLIKTSVCPSCQGDRIKPYPQNALLAGKSIGEITRLSIDECMHFFNELHLSGKEGEISKEIIKEIKERLNFLKNVGLSYLTLDRIAPSLSGGESQRVRLASQIGSGLIGITYILDEPSIGLHQRDNQKLIKTLKELKDHQNTVIVVEHDEDTIKAADYIVDFGPGPGTQGGEIVYEGPISEFHRAKNSLTANYLYGKKKIPLPRKRKAPRGYLTIQGAEHHNLKNIDVSIPLGVMTAITGVSGSGKSSLVLDILYPALSNQLHGSEIPVGKVRKVEGFETIDKVIAIDQSPIGRTPRSNPVTYIKVFDDIRELFANLPESKAKGWKKGRFSFNVKEGTCHQCLGLGMVKVDMDFLEEAWVECPLCLGKRFDNETLSILFKGKNISEILEMDVEEAKILFANQPSIFSKLHTLCKVGLGYIKLGQSSTTLSGGEAQRIKLAKELARKATGNTFYIFDEPTTGLHFHDISHLVSIFNELVEKGNSILVIEHHLDIIKCADWIIDLGPEGGAFGGEVIGEGKPESIIKLPTPTGEALKKVLQKKKTLESPPKKEKKKKPKESKIFIEGASQHNLKMIDTSIPRNKITIFTGPSGSGKSSLAFDTIYAEGQRRYVESLSPYARQFVNQMPKASVQEIHGLSPAIAIEQRAHMGNPRSTVGTLTEVYDYLRILFSCIGAAHCPETKEPLQAIGKEVVAEKILSFDLGDKVQIMSPLHIRKKEEFLIALSRLRQLGFVRVRLNGVFLDLDLNEEEFLFDPKRKNELLLVIDRIKVSPQEKGRILESLEKALEFNDKEVVLQREEEDIPFNLTFSALSSGKSYPSITPKTFAFNTQEGMCLDCLGLGVQYGADLALNKDIMEETPITYLRQLFGPFTSKQALELIYLFLKEENINPQNSLNQLTKKNVHLIMNGFPENTFLPSKEGFSFRFRGINETLAKVGRSGRSQLKQAALPLLNEVTCYSCMGSRINPLARNVLIEGLSIADLTKMPIEDLSLFIKNIPLKKKERKLVEEVIKNIETRLAFLIEVGLGFLSLDRKAPSLSGGESQRIRLAKQLGSGLVGVLYVLDEPTIGLHPKDIEKLNRALKKLRDLGNTLILVEHDRETIKEGDFLLDFGPESGIHGGHITAQGTYEEILSNPESLTGAYLSGRREIPFERNYQEKGFFTLRDAVKHNLKKLSLRFPLGALTCITGVSGSGKSTLMNGVLAPLMHKGIGEGFFDEDPLGKLEGISSIDKLIQLNQSPIGLTIRATTATYMDILTPLRDFFSKLKSARTRGLSPKNFSYNHRAGMCTHCYGLGFLQIEMYFMPSIHIQCPECKGNRLNPLSLEVFYEGKNLGEHLKSTVEEASKTFENHPKVKRLLQGLITVGLGYLRLDQEISTLSGGEAQRLKLARELVKRSSGNTLYLLDEPTTGLHAHDIAKLMPVIAKLLKKGNTFIVIEHNMDFIQFADWIVDLGPECGDKGGEIVYQGPLAGIYECKNSHTGKYLAKWSQGNKPLT